MNAFDIFLIVFLLVAGVWGFYSGIVRQLGALAGIVLGIIACRLYGDWAVGILAGSAQSESSRIALTVLAYVLLFVIVYLACILLGRLLRRMLHGLSLGIIDRLAGALFRMFLWFFALSFLLNIWVSIVPESAPTGQWAQRTLGFAPAVLGSQTASELWQTSTPA